MENSIKHNLVLKADKGSVGLFGSTVANEIVINKI